MPISELEKQMKVYFSDWLKTIMTNEVIDKPIDTLKTELQTYVELNIKNYGRAKENGPAESFGAGTNGAENNGETIA
jgi:hypothetical protein